MDLDGIGRSGEDWNDEWLTEEAVHKKLRALGSSKRAAVRVLFLKNNKLTRLPELMREMTGLRALVLSKNQLVELPAWLAELPKLKELDLSGNALPGKANRRLKSRREIQKVLGALPLAESGWTKSKKR